MLSSTLSIPVWPNAVSDGTPVNDRRVACDGMRDGAKGSHGKPGTPDAGMGQSPFLTGGDGSILKLGLVESSRASLPGPAPPTAPLFSIKPHQTSHYGLSLSGWSRVIVIVWSVEDERWTGILRK